MANVTPAQVRALNPYIQMQDDRQPSTPKPKFSVLARFVFGMMAVIPMAILTAITAPPPGLFSFPPKLDGRNLVLQILVHGSLVLFAIPQKSDPQWFKRPNFGNATAATLGIFGNGCVQVLLWMNSINSYGTGQTPNNTSAEISPTNATTSDWLISVLYMVLCIVAVIVMIALTISFFVAALIVSSALLTTFLALLIVSFNGRFQNGGCEHFTFVVENFCLGVAERARALGRSLHEILRRPYQVLSPKTPKSDLTTVASDVLSLKAKEGTHPEANGASVNTIV
ncbi:hypothetical protein AAF712_005568 [Marasmius tenuissimus]|uniref:Uncharacterized protein n=1 Tax=Marasmius tenuissimus TaxID=585030 RepID=A0ABR3A006_9AGAR